MAISGHKNEASIRSYSSNVSEDQSRNMSNSLALPIAQSDTDGNAYGYDCSPTGVNKSPRSSTSMDFLQDVDVPPSPLLNQVMSTVMSPTITTSKDIFRFNKFDRCTININYNN